MAGSVIWRRRIAGLRSRQIGKSARDIDLPLPVNGLNVKASTSELAGVYAARMENLRSDGVQLELRAPYARGISDDSALNRIPYEFGDRPRYVNLRPLLIDSDNASIEIPGDVDAMAAYISSNVLIADRTGNNIVRYDGTTITPAVFTLPDASTLSGHDGIISHQDRIYLWKTNGLLQFWYGDVGAVQGAVLNFPLDRLGNITGAIARLMSLTIDAGNSYNDALCIITTTGDIVVYEGNDPGDAQNWQLSIRLRATPPLSRHGFARVGSDVWMLTASGLVSIAETLSTGILALVSNISLPISDRITQLAASGVGEWQMHTAADGSKIIVNYWLNGAAEQFMFDVQSKSWSTATIPARRWHNLGRLTQFTDGGGVIGTLLLADDTSEPKTAILHTGWFRMPQAGVITYVKPAFLAKGPVTVKVAVLVDHDESAAAIAERTITMTLSPDNPPDAGGTAMLSETIGVGAAGDVFQFRIEVTATWLKIVNMRLGVL